MSSINHPSSEKGPRHEKPIHALFCLGIGDHDEQGRPVSSGVYLYRVQTQEQVLVGKIALIR